jgi:hypothetical protein
MNPHRNITIIEPHYDDAWINLGGYILKHPEIGFKIISISYDGFNKAYETQKLANLLPNVETKALKLRGIHWNLIHRIKRENYLRYFLKVNKLESLSDLSKIIEGECKNEDLILMPLGTLHPQHVVVSSLKLNLPIKHYIEWPYCYEEPGYFDKFMSSAETIDVSDVIGRKIEIFSQVYKTQIDILEMVPKSGTLLSKNYREIIVS